MPGGNDVISLRTFYGRRRKDCTKTGRWTKGLISVLYMLRASLHFICIHSISLPLTILKED